jgi:hypothetical protein
MREAIVPKASERGAGVGSSIDELIVEQDLRRRLGDSFVERNDHRDLLSGGGDRAADGPPVIPARQTVIVF